MPDVLFYRALDALEDVVPPYMGMAREFTAPFYHERERLHYDFRGKTYAVPLPFPIWTFSSGVALFNLERLRRHDLIEHFLAFSLQNVHCIGNLDQSLLNYFFGKRITRLKIAGTAPLTRPTPWTRRISCTFTDPSPGISQAPGAGSCSINHFEALRRVWLEYLAAGRARAGGKLGVSRAAARPEPARASALKYLTERPIRPPDARIFLLFGVHRSPKSSKAHWCGMAFGLPGPGREFEETRGTGGVTIMARSAPARCSLTRRASL